MLLRSSAPPLIGLLLALAGPADAQPLVAGDRVRAHGPGTAGRWCEARVAAVASDTLVLAPVRRCPPNAFAPDTLGRAAVAHLQVVRGHRGSRAAHALLGLSGGAAVGALAANIAAGDGCGVAGCSDGGYAAALMTVAGGVGGAVLGAAIGAVLPAGPRWVRTAAPQPVRRSAPAERR